MERSFMNFVKIKDLDAAERRRVASFHVDFSLFSNNYILPGFTDVHVHLREPGFLYKETIKSGTMAAAAGGFTDVFTMPNLDPCPDCMAHLKVQLDAIQKDAMINVYPYGAITKEEAGTELAQMEEISHAAIAFSDDGKGVASKKIMRNAMEKAKALDKIIVAHCEDISYPKESAESEWKQLARDLELVRETKCRYHVCHVSTKESVELIRDAKMQGLDITCETAPHYLTISADQIQDSGKFKMNPPIKDQKDRTALIEAVKDGTIDMIATDHAPHSAEEKNKGFAGSAFGVVGLETAFPVLFTHLVEPGVISLEKLIDLLYKNPRERFGLPVKPLQQILNDETPTFTIWNLDEAYIIDPKEFLSKGKSTPFDGWHVKGRCLMTVMDGTIVWSREK